MKTLKVMQITFWDIYPRKDLNNIYLIVEFSIY